MEPPFTYDEINCFEAQSFGTKSYKMSYLKSEGTRLEVYLKISKKLFYKRGQTPTSTYCEYHKIITNSRKAIYPISISTNSRERNREANRRNNNRE